MDRPAQRSRRSWWVALSVGAVLVAGLATLGARTVLGPTAPTSPLGAPSFVEVAAPSGVDHAYRGEWPHLVGGGVATFDCSGDGYPDLYLAGGEGPAALYRNVSREDGPRFERIDDEVAALDAVTGAYPIDLDGDGVSDLVVLRAGENVLLRGLGGCRFERANERFGFDGGAALTTAFSATWEHGASLPTLAFGNYVEGGDDGDRFDRCHDNVLLRPDGAGERYAAPSTLGPGYCALSMLFSDWNRSGHADLRVSNDRHYNRDGAEQLWAIEPGRPPRLYEEQDGWQRLEIWGMGIASHDVTGDGYPDVLLTSQGDNKLQTLVDGPAQPTYEDIAIRRGVTAHRPFAGPDTALPSTAWHPQFEDVNNDGFVDLFLAKGNVSAQVDHAADDPNNLLLGQPDGTFEEAADAAGLVSFAQARGAALVDLDLDGWLDLVVVNRNDPVELWHNQGVADVEADARSVAIRVIQPGSNRDAIGGWLEVRLGDHEILRELTVGGGHASGQLGWQHLGLAGSRSAEVRVHWPDGEVDDWHRIDAGTRVLLQRGADAPEIVEVAR